MSGLSCSPAVFLGWLGNTVSLSVADVFRTFEYPIVVLEAAAAAVWRMGEGFMGGGVLVFLDGAKALPVLIGFVERLVLELGRGLGWEARTLAADLEERVDGPLVSGWDFLFWRIFVEGLVLVFNAGSLGRALPRIDAIVVWYVSSAFSRASTTALQVSPRHSFSMCMQGND